MTIFLVPSIPEDPKDLIDLCSKSRIPCVNATKLSHFLGKFSEEAESVVSINSRSLAILTTYTVDLLDQPPVIMLDVPGCVYPTDWLQVASPLPSKSFTDFAREHHKVGLSGNNLDQIQQAVNNQRSSAAHVNLSSQKAQEDLANDILGSETI